MRLELPRILGPNLGCPIVLSLEELGAGFDLVVAEETGSPADQLSLLARPSYPEEGKEFILELGNRQELTEGTLPPVFKDVNETRFLISTTLHSSIFAGKARFFRYQAKPVSRISQAMLRRIGEEVRATLYDLTLIKGEYSLGTVFHALGLRPGSDRLRFIHLTDLHIALRNDLYQDNLHENITYPAFQDPSKTHFNNFNENLRQFIRYANELADRGELDLVLVLGDLVDFVRHGFNEREDHGRNNIRVFRDLVLGTGREKTRPKPNLGLKIPIFTSTGNHDWRSFPYDVARKPSAFGVNDEIAKQLDLFWADEQEEISRKIDTVYANLLREGAPVSRRTSWGRWLNQVLRRLEKWQVKLLTPVSAAAVMGFLAKFSPAGGFLEKNLGAYYPLMVSAITLVIVPILVETLTGCMKWFIRQRIFDLVAIEAGWQALKDYFLNINPYFNYGFRLGRNYFLILDTGHDCVRAQYLWDDGDKKMGPLSIHDNTIGQSPDSMAFYDINEYYPYSQIGWIQRLMDLIARESNGKKQPSRIFIGLHAPPANLSRKERQRAEQEIVDKRQGLLLTEGFYNIRYGTINHYLSHFFHLCLGRVEDLPRPKPGSWVDMVLAGHAHRKLEFRLTWDEEKKGPLVYFGDFTGKDNQDHFQEDFDKLRPFLFQTPACGPREDFFPDPPYFRFIEIDGEGKMVKAEVVSLGADGTAEVPQCGKGSA